MKRRGPLHNQKRSQVAMDTKWEENRQAKLQKKTRLISIKVLEREEAAQPFQIGRQLCS